MFIKVYMMEENDMNVPTFEIISCYTIYYFYYSRSANLHFLLLLIFFMILLHVTYGTLPLHTHYPTLGNRSLHEGLIFESNERIHKAFPRRKIF